MDKQGQSYEEISQPYYFETDHVALKENADYRNLLHTIALLEAQRQQAARDIESLYKAQDEAMADPVGFVQKLQQGKDFCFPRVQKVASLPEIQWDKYACSTDFSSFGSSRHMTRNKRNVVETAGNNSQSPSSSTVVRDQAQSDNNDVLVLVRGRTKDSSKSATFNQLWTEEEQQRLESLLIQFPPEEVESRRWSKIAAALGNRTAVQVASRVQKYFLRLAKEGLPIPGRMPNLAHYSRRGSHRHHRYNRLYYPNSTFMQSHTPPVWMREDGDEFDEHLQPGPAGPDSWDGGSRSMSETVSLKNDSSDEESYTEELQNCPEYQELQRLLRVKKEMLSQDRTAVVRHLGYKCDNCGTEPIIGTRWHCVDCPAELSFDFCDDCCDLSFQQDKHDSSHRLQPFKHVSLDSDYMGDSTTEYNYLDPNYMPAS